MARRLVVAAVCAVLVCAAYVADLRADDVGYQYDDAGRFVKAIHADWTMPYEDDLAANLLRRTGAVRPARTWLLRRGWRRGGGAISPNVIPGRPAGSPPLPL